MNPDELVQIATEIVNHGRERGAAIRLFGGVAVYAHCPSIPKHAKVQREYADLDFVAPAAAWKVLPDLFIGRGFRMRVNAPGRATFTRDELTADVRGTIYRDYYSFDFGPRLEADRLTLPLVDQLLCKLQRIELREKDVQDVIALLLDHEVTKGGGKETIDGNYLIRLTSSNWGLWTTIYDNMVTLEKITDRYVEPQAAQQVWRRIEAIQGALDSQAKSLGWWLRAIPNKRLKWYGEPPEEVAPEKLQVRV